MRINKSLNTPKKTPGSGLIVMALVCGMASFAQGSICSEAFERSQAQLPSGGSLSADQRMRILCDLRDTIQNKYALLSLKKKRLGFDGLARLDACIALEGKIATSNLNHFEDRVLSCLAPFRDSHISMRAQQVRPSVASGVYFRLVGGEIVVSGVDDKILDLTQKEFGARGDTRTLKSILQIGRVVEAVDGQAPQTWMSWLQQYIIKSSPTAVVSHSVRDLTLRNYSYPQSPYLTLKLKGEAQPVQLNWYVSPVALRDDLRELLLRDLKLRTLRSLGFAINRPADGYNAGFVGYDERNPLATVQEVVYLNRNGVPSVRTGELNLAGMNVCYLQISTSGRGDDELALKAASGAPVRVKRTKAMADFVSACKAKSVPMVVDLRHNIGGNLNNAIADAHVMAPSNQILPSALTSGRFTPHLRQVFGEFSLAPEVPLSDGSRFVGDRFYLAIQQAESAGLEHVPAVTEPNLNAHPLVGGYDQRVVVMLGHQCGSGCEITASILKTRTNTILIGEPAHGTGGQEQTSTLFPLAVGYRDDVYGTISVDMPNALYGVSASPVKDAQLVPFDQIEGQIMENQPVQPDQRFLHSTSLEDVTNNNAGWLRVIEEAIKAP